MKHFLRKCWQERNTTFVVRYDSTDLAYTQRGPRIEGKLEKKGFLRAWLWGQAWCMKYPRAEVHLQEKKVQA